MNPNPFPNQNLQNMLNQQAHQRAAETQQRHMRPHGTPHRPVHPNLSHRPPSHYSGGSGGGFFSALLGVVLVIGFLFFLFNFVL
ncbi:hypothetical protein Sru01_68310 [Sphaerisporangium rufum]|uniref:Uncharacterized protein n=1 Tax=Sphaerisporangium rufum TaxID=1381558 RepID=A0A919R938_9ACTN|nr:hypothetical protein [Sphaerisporangium rufum]GII81849.1 hypothetical protein Sru01_68310 [Sphaerisporangium rufum]